MLLIWIINSLIVVFLYNIVLKGFKKMTDTNTDVPESENPVHEENNQDVDNINEIEEPITLEVIEETNIYDSIDNMYYVLHQDISRLIQWIIVNSFYYYSRVADMIEYVYDRFRPSRDLLLLATPKFYELPDEIALNPKINSKYWAVMPFSYDGKTYYRCLLTQDKEGTGIFEMPKYYLETLKTFNKPLLISTLSLKNYGEVISQDTDISTLMNKFIIPGNQIFFCDALKYFWLKIILSDTSENADENINEHVLKQNRNIIESIDETSDLDNYDMTINIIDLDLNEYIVKSGLLGVEMRSLTYEEI